MACKTSPSYRPQVPIGTRKIYGIFPQNAVRPGIMTSEGTKPRLWEINVGVNPAVDPTAYTKHCHYFNSPLAYWRIKAVEFWHQRTTVEMPGWVRIVATRMTRHRVLQPQAMGNAGLREFCIPRAVPTSYQSDANKLVGECKSQDPDGGARHHL